MDLQKFRALTGAVESASVATAEPFAVAPSGNERAVSVSALNAYIRGLIAGDACLADITVRGEISNFTAHRSGHLYFSLKDEGALVRAVMFRTAAVRLRFRPETGMKVLVHGNVSVYEKTGEYQLYASDMEPDGIGSLYLAFEERKRRLEAEGLFDPARKRALPRYPHRIGVITSPTGAAIRDILHILGRRYPIAEVLLYPSLVQGEEAPLSLVRALSWFNLRRAADVLIIGRGGGSFEDLFAFQDEGLARAIAESEIPVISAVGHETDFSISDFVADRRAPTPSAAAEIAVPDMAELLLRLSESGTRMKTGLLATLAGRKRALNALKTRPLFSRPDRLYYEPKTTLLRQSEALSHAAERMLLASRARLGECGGKLDALSPLAVLSRGYAAAFDEAGGLLSSVENAAVGDRIAVRMADGTLTARVEDIVASQGVQSDKKGK